MKAQSIISKKKSLTINSFKFTCKHESSLITLIIIQNLVYLYWTYKNVNLKFEK
jgi:hypothetical protein